MKTFVPSLLGAIVALALTASSAGAGVVLYESHVTGRGTPPQARTVYIQGNREKIVTPRSETIIDLDQGKMYLVNRTHRYYNELPFPPQDNEAHLLAAAGVNSVTFTKNGTTDKVAGYPCNGYTGNGKFSHGQVTVNECVSTAAPGAQEFTEFHKAMLQKLHGSLQDLASQVPAGVPMEQKISMSSGISQMPNMPQNQAENMRGQMGSAPTQGSSIEVTKIESKQLPDSTFEVPSGFSKQEAPAKTMR